MQMTNATMTKIPYNVTTSWNPLIDHLDENDPLLTTKMDSVAVTTSATSSNSKNISETDSPDGKMKSAENATMPSLERRLSTLSLHSSIAKNKSKQEITTTTTNLWDKKKQFEMVDITCDSKSTALSFTPGLELECYPKTPNGGSGSDGDTERAHKTSFYSNNNNCKSSSNSTISSSSSSTIRSNSSSMSTAYSPSSSPFSSSMMPWEMMLQTSPDTTPLLATPTTPWLKSSSSSSSSSHDYLLSEGAGSNFDVLGKEHCKSGLLSTSIDAKNNHGTEKLTGIAADTTATPPTDNTTAKIWCKRFCPVSSPSSPLCNYALSAPSAAKNPKVSSTTTPKTPSDDLENLFTGPLLTSPAAYMFRAKKEPRIGLSPPPLLASSIVRLRNNLTDKKNRVHHVNAEKKNEAKNESKSSTLPSHISQKTLSSSIPATTTTTTVVNKTDARSGKRR